MYCRHCGKKIDDDSKFCRYCGAHVIELNTDDEDTDSISKTNISSKVSKADTFDEIVPTDENNKTEPVKKNKVVENEFSHDSKIMNVLGIISGILIWGMFGILGLGLLAGVLFLLYFFIMMRMPNGMGITIFLILFVVILIFVVKLIINIIKSFRK